MTCLRIGTLLSVLWAASEEAGNGIPQPVGAMRAQLPLNPEAMLQNKQQHTPASIPIIDMPRQLIPILGVRDWDELGTMLIGHAERP